MFTSVVPGTYEGFVSIDKVYYQCIYTTGNLRNIALLLLLTIIGGHDTSKGRGIIGKQGVQTCCLSSSCADGRAMAIWGKRTAMVAVMAMLEKCILEDSSEQLERSLD